MKYNNPLPYYGGKHNLLKYILPIVEQARSKWEAKILVEPFCGGASVTWNSREFGNYIINDNFDELINFYRVAKTRLDELINELDLIPHSRSIYQKMRNESKRITDPLQRAVIFYCMCFSFANKYRGGFSYSVINSCSKGWVSRKKKVEQLLGLIDNVTIENADALTIIDKYDSEKTLFYVDPPYPDTYQGHYKGYTYEDFGRLLDKLKSIKGKYILSCYAKNIDTKDFVFCESVTQKKSVKRVKDGAKRKTKAEAIVGNFKLV